MKGEEPKIIQRHGAVHPKEEVDHKGKFQDHIGRKLFGQVLIAFPGFRKIADVELGGAHKFTALAHMPFQHSNGIVQGEAQRYREKGKEQFYIVHKIVKTAALYTFVGEPIADKENDGTGNEKAGGLKDPSQMAKGVFDVQHGDAQEGHNEHTEEHTAVQKVHYPVELGLKGDVLGGDDT